MNRSGHRRSARLGANLGRNWVRKVKDDPHSAGRGVWTPGIRCLICGEKIHLYQRFNFDHVIPMALGGSRGRRNKVLTHVICNTVKGSQYPFSLHTAAERNDVRARVSKKTWSTLCAVWEGLPG